MDSKKIILVTCANIGLGYKIILALAGPSQAYEILLGEFPNSKTIIRPVQIDISDDKSIDILFNLIKEDSGKLDVLVNNAGIQLDQQWMAGKMSMRDMWSESCNLNVVSTNVITHQFAPLLLNSDDPRLYFMASGTSSLTTGEGSSLTIKKSSPKGWPKDQFSLPAYRSIKTGMNMMMREWYRTLKEDGVKVWCIFLGHLATGLGGNAEAMKKMGGMGPSVGVKFVKDVIEGKRDADVGKVIHKDGIQPL